MPGDVQIWRDPCGSGYIEVCKESSATNPVPLNGIYDFTISGSAFSSANNPLAVQVGECSGPILATAPVATVTELPTPGVGLYSVTTSGYSPAPLSQQEGNTLLESFSPQALSATVFVQASTVGLTDPFSTPGTPPDPSLETVVTFTNYEAPPAQLKICKVAGSTSVTGPFYFTVLGITAAGSGYTAAPAVTFTGGGCTTQPTATTSISGGLVSGITLTSAGAGCTTASTVTIAPPPSASGTQATASMAIVPVEAGPPAEGGYCEFVPGMFEVGTLVTITETVPGGYGTPYPITVNGVKTAPSAGCGGSSSIASFSCTVVAQIGAGTNEVSFTNNLSAQITGGGGATANYVGVDTKTQGTWTAVHGADGNIIASEAAAPPTYATVKVNGAAQWVWAASTADPRALQTVSGSSARLASTYYAAGSFTININLTDGNTHRVGLYLLDWDSHARAETITLIDASANAVLDTENYSNFHGGVYAIWDIKGDVTIEVTDTSGANAVVAGLFFDPPPSAAATASYVGTDTSTQGTWSGKYGSTGQLIANDVNNPPSFAAVSLAGDSVYTWNAATTDPRALQAANGAASRIASAYYAGGSFSINVNLTDGNTHKISLYLVDWDGRTRAETISILDATSHVTLNSQSYSSFNGGNWAVWNVTGNVIIQVTDTGGANAVVSGIFLD